MDPIHEPMPVDEQAAQAVAVILYIVACISTFYFAPPEVILEWAKDMYEWMEWLLIG